MKCENCRRDEPDRRRRWHWRDGYGRLHVTCGECTPTLIDGVPVWNLDTTWNQD